MSSANFKQPLIYNGANYGTIAVQAQEQGGMQQSIKMKLRGNNLLIGS